MTPPSDQFNDAGRASYNASLDSNEEVVAKVEFLVSYLAAQADLIESAKRWKGEAEAADAVAKVLREALEKVRDGRTILDEESVGNWAAGILAAAESSDGAT